MAGFYDRSQAQAECLCHFTLSRTASVAPTDSVAIITFTSEVQVVQPFSMDRDALVDALGKIRLSTAPVADSVTHLQAIQEAARFLSIVAGKKQLLYFSAGLTTLGGDNQAQLRASIDAAVRANVAIFPFTVSEQ